MKKDNQKYRGKLELDTLDQLNSIADDIQDVRGLVILLSQYFDETKKIEQERLYQFYGVLNEQIMHNLYDLANELKEIVSQIETK